MFYTCYTCYIVPTLFPHAHFKVTYADMRHYRRMRVCRVSKCQQTRIGFGRAAVPHRLYALHWLLEYVRRHFQKPFRHTLHLHSQAAGVGKVERDCETLRRGKKFWRVRQDGGVPSRLLVILFLKLIRNRNPARSFPFYALNTQHCSLALSVTICRIFAGHIEGALLLVYFPQASPQPEQWM